MFRYTLWHFYVFSGTNLLTSRHRASSLFSAIFVFQKSYTGNILGIGQNKFLKSYFSRKLREIRRGVRGGATRAPHTRAARPSPWPRPLCVRAPRSTSDDAPSPIKTPDRKNLRTRSIFQNTSRRSGGSRSSSRHPAGEGNHHRRSPLSPCLPPEQWMSSLPWTMGP
jgi:hypothetical protein